MKRKTLIASILYGQFSAASVERWGVKSSWASPDPVKDLDGLRGALLQAVEKTGYKGRRVAFVMENALFEHHYLQIPSMSRRDLEIYLRRKADSLKTFHGDAVFSYNTATSPKGGMVVLLNLIPKWFMDGMVAVCEELELNPVMLVPASTVLASRLRSLSLEKDEIVALVGQAANKLELVIGMGDGSILFDRHMGYDIGDEGRVERLAREARRSTLFSKQQFGVAVSRVIMIGRYEPGLTERIREIIEVPVKQLEDEDVSLFWVRETMTLSPAIESNLISPQIRKKPLRRLFVKITVAMLLVLWVGAALGVGLIEFYVAVNRSSVERFSGKIASLQAERDKWAQRNERLAQWNTALTVLKEGRLPPVPAWLLGYLGESLPDGLILTAVDIRKDEFGWLVTLEGKPLGGPTDAAQSLKVFERRLTDGPYRMTVTADWRGKWVEQLKSGAMGIEPGKGSFRIEGRIQ